MTRPRRRRWYDVLRRPTIKDGAARAAGSDDLSLWHAEEQVARAVRESSSLAERVASSVAHQRGGVDAAAERAGLVAARALGLDANVARVSEAFDRLGMVALNAGLEGARVAEPHGRALLLLSEEIRAFVTRGAEAARDVSAVSAEIATEAGELRRQLEAARAEVGEVGEEAGRMRMATEEASIALEELAQRLRRATGMDAEVARAVSAASDHARGLMTALSTLTTAAQGAPGLRTLGPVVAPLARLLADLGELGDEEEGGPGSNQDTPA